MTRESVIKIGSKIGYYVDRGSKKDQTRFKYVLIIFRFDEIRAYFPLLLSINNFNDTQIVNKNRIKNRLVEDQRRIKLDLNTPR